MKLSASKWLAFLGALTSRNSTQLNERQPTDTSSLEMFPAPLGTFTLPPGPQTLVVSLNTLRIVEQFSSITITTTYISTALFVTTEGPVIYFPTEKLLPGANLYVEGDSNLLVSATASVATTESVLTSTTCTSPVCSPTPTAIDYTCGVSNGVTQPLTTVMQSFSCTTGQVCEGVPVKTTLNCNCGGPICTTVLPFIPIPPIIIPVGAPIPPAVPGPPEAPDSVPEPEITITEDPTKSPPTSTSEESSDKPTSTSSDPTSSGTSSASSSSSSSSTSSSTTSSSNSSASACSLGGFTIAPDFESTLSAWIAQFPFTLPATLQSNTTSTTSKSLVSSSSVTSSSTTNTPKPDPTPTPTPTPEPTPSQTATSGPKPTSASCNVACLSSSVSASSAFEASLASSMAAGHSSFAQSLSGTLSSQAASVSSAQQAQSSTQSAISKCQHYTIPYPWNPPNLPATLATYHGASDAGRWMCVIDPNQIDTRAEWNSTWDYQPFGIDKSWDKNNPKKTLVDTFCEYLVNEKADVTALGEVQGVCQAYDLGQCLNPTRSGGCTWWEHPWTTLDTWGPVMISVSYDKICPTDKNSRPVNFGAVGAAGCKKSLNALINSCSFPKNKQKDWAEDDPSIGGTIWSECMIYTIVGIKEGNKPKIIWHN